MSMSDFNKPKREKCEICKKYNYIHDILLVCNLDYKPYHSKCLKISNNVALELQHMPDWFCPECIKDTSRKPGLRPLFVCVPVPIRP